MKLPDEVLAIIREERHETGYALLKPHVVRSRVIERMRERQIVRRWVFGPLWEFACAPSIRDIRTTIRALKKDHANLIRVYDDELYLAANPQGLVTR